MSRNGPTIFKNRFFLTTKNSSLENFCSIDPNHAIDITLNRLDPDPPHCYIYYWLTKESTFSLLQMTKLQEWLTGLVMVLAVWLALLSGDGGQLLCICSRAVDPHSFFVDPDPAAFLNADPDPA